MDENQSEQLAQMLDRAGVAVAKPLEKPVQEVTPPVIEPKEEKLSETPPKEVDLKTVYEAEGGPPIHDQIEPDKEPKEEKKVEDPPKEGDEKEKKPEKTREELLTDQNAALLAQINELASGKSNIFTDIEVPKVPVAPGVAPVVGEETPKVEPQSFIADDNEFMEAINTKDGFNKVLQKVYDAGQSSAQVPAPASDDASVVDMKFALRDYYVANPDLGSIQDYVGAVVVSKYRGEKVTEGTPFIQVLEETGNEVRETLHLPKPKEVLDRDLQPGPENELNSETPVFAPAPGSRGAPGPSKEKRQSLPSDQNQVAEMIQYSKENR